MFSTPWNSVHRKQGDPKPAIDADTVVIYGMRFCPYTERVILTSLEKGLRFSVVNINLSNKPDWFLEISPSGSVPVVQYKNETVTGSVEASKFVEKIGEENLQSSDKIMEDKFQKIIKKSSEGLDRLYKTVGVGTENRTPKDRKQNVQDISDILSFFEYELGGTKTFYGGDRPNLVDLMIWPLFERLPMLPILYPSEDMNILSRHRKMSGWVESMKTLSSVTKYKMEPEKLAKFYDDFANKKEISYYDSTVKEITENSKYPEGTKHGRQ